MEKIVQDKQIIIPSKDIWKEYVTADMMINIRVSEELKNLKFKKRRGLL